MTLALGARPAEVRRAEVKRMMYKKRERGLQSPRAASAIAMRQQGNGGLHERTGFSIVLGEEVGSEV